MLVLDRKFCLVKTGEGREGKVAIKFGTVFVWISDFLFHVLRGMHWLHNSVQCSKMLHIVPLMDNRFDGQDDTFIAYVGDKT